MAKKPLPIHVFELATLMVAEESGKYELSHLGRGERPVPVRPDSGLTNPISGPPRTRAAGSQVVDSRPRSGYPLFMRGGVDSEFATSDLRPSPKREIPINVLDIHLLRALAFSLGGGGGMLIQLGYLIRSLFV
mgnify:CR=1 FL=1